MTSRRTGALLVGGIAIAAGVVLALSKWAKAALPELPPGVPPEAEVPQISPKPVVPEEELAEMPVIDFGEIAILGINGKAFIDVLGTQASLAEPIVMSSLNPITVNWQNGTMVYGDNLLGLIFFLRYQPASGVVDIMSLQYPPGYIKIVILTQNWRPLYEDSFRIDTFIDGAWAGGYYSPGLYNGVITWAPYYYGGGYGKQQSFTVKNMVKCTGKGTI